MDQPLRRSDRGRISSSKAVKMELTSQCRKESAAATEISMDQPLRRSDRGQISSSKAGKMELTSQCRKESAAATEISMDQPLCRSEKGKISCSKAVKMGLTGQCRKEPAAATDKRKLFKSQAMKLYRARIKQRPLRHALEVEKNKAKCLKRRQNLTEDQKRKERERSKLRMRLYRANKKESGKPSAQAQREQRLKWRDDCRINVETVSSEIKRSNSEVRRHIYAERKAIEAKTRLNRRQNLTEDQKRKERESARLRMCLYRAKKRESCELSAQAQRVQRLMWRDDYRKKVETMSSEKKRRINERRRHIYAERKAMEAKTRQQVPEQMPSEEDETMDARTPSAARSVVRKALPSHPTTYARTPSAARSVVRKALPSHSTTVWEIARAASPRKRLLFKEAEAETPVGRIGRSVTESVQDLKVKNNKEEKDRKTFILQAILPRDLNIRKSSQRTGIHQKTMKNATALKGRRRKASKYGNVTEFFREKATVCPDKKAVSKKTGVASSVLSSSVKGSGTGFSTFSKCRPENVKLMANSKTKNKSLCESCQNVNLKLKVANKILPGNCWLLSSKAAVDVTVCHQPTVDCYYRRCQNCGPQKLKEWMERLHILDNPLKWHRWEYKTASFNGKQVKRKVLASKTGGSDVFLDELSREVAFLSEHLFRANWQSNQFRQITKNLTEGQVVTVLDFAENYACFQQDEVQSAHWRHEQVTIHPVVCYYRCDVCHETMTESIIAISDDMIHDYHAARAIVFASLHHLRSVRGLKVKHVVQWTDGCANQYKAKGPFYDLAHSMSGCKLKRHFFESRHGKEPSDGESAVVRQFVTRAVTAGHAVVTNAAEFFYFCQKSTMAIKGTDGCTHFRRSFLWIGSKDIERTKRPIKTLKGTWQFHSLFSDKSGHLYSRHLTCSCNSCISASNELCMNEHTVGPWTLHQFADSPMDANNDDLPDSVSLPEASCTAPDEDVQEQHIPQYRMNDCIVVRYPDRCYPGVIQDVLDEELKVKFLKPHAKDRQKFVYPAVEDIQIVAPSSVVSKINLIPKGSSFREWIVPEFSDWF